MKNYSYSFNHKEKRFIAKYKKNDGTWGTKWLPKEFQIHQEQEAEKHLISWLDQYYKAGTSPDRSIPIQQAPTTIAYLAPKWLEYRNKHEKTARNTYKGFEYAVRCWILDNPNFQHYSIQDLDLAQNQLSVSALTAWIHSLHGKPKTRMVHIRTLRTLIDDCISLEWLDPDSTNPARRPHINQLFKNLEQQAEEDKIIAHLNYDQIRGLLSHPQLPAYRRIRYLLAVLQGFRDHELQGMTWKDVDFINKTLTISKQLLKIGCSPWIHEKDLNIPSKEQISLPNAIMSKPKTSGSRRTLPMHDEVIKALKWWKRVGWRHHVGRMPSDSDPLIPRGNKGRLVPASQPGNFFFSESANNLRIDLVRANLPTTFTDQTKGMTVDLVFHSLRHTFSHLLESEGVDEHQIGVLLGHGAKTTARSNYLGRNLDLYSGLVNRIQLHGIWDGTSPEAKVIPIESRKKQA